MKILYSSMDLRDAITKILARPNPRERRVVLLSAFVGGQAQAFLPSPKGLEIVCWLQPGSTDALTLGRLRNRGAKIYKSEHLHMKIYWSSHGGFVVCSANASGSALGGGTQKEFGVLLPPKVVDIQRLWVYAKPRPITKNDLERLAVLGDAVPRPKTTSSSERSPDFVEWQNLPGRRAWKLGWWDTGDAEFAEAAVKAVREVYGVRQPNQCLHVKQQHTRSGDWLLQFKLPGVTNLEWMHVDFVVKVRKSEPTFEKEFPFQAIQAHGPRAYRPPFRITNRFRQAFKKAAKAYGQKRIEQIRSAKPPKELLRKILQRM
jgi:hypothetical protein